MMTKRLRGLANSVATRRGFFGKLGRGAAVVATGLGGLLAFPADAQAKKGGGKKPQSDMWLCTYDCENPVYGKWTVIVQFQECPSYWGDPCWGPLIKQRKYKGDPPPEEEL
jgi:hypothetical protein